MKRARFPTRARTLEDKKVIARLVQGDDHECRHSDSDELIRATSEPLRDKAAGGELELQEMLAARIRRPRQEVVRDSGTTEIDQQTLIC